MGKNKGVCLANPMLCDFSALVFRVIIGLIFLKYGWDKLADIDGTVEMFGGAFGLPAPTFMAWLIAIAEVLGGLALIIGIKVRWAAIGLAVIMLGALIIVHLPGRELTPMAQLTIALFASCFGILAAGAGKWSVCGGCKCDSK